MLFIRVTESFYTLTKVAYFNVWLAVKIFTPYTLITSSLWFGLNVSIRTLKILNNLTQL